MKRAIQGIILTVGMLFETVVIIGGIGATFDSKINAFEGILFSSLAFLWFATSCLGIFELKNKKDWIIIPALAIKFLIFLFFAGILGIVEGGDVRIGVFFMILSVCILIPVIICKIRYFPKVPAAISAPANSIFNKYKFDGFRSKHHWDQAAMDELGETKVTDENSDEIYLLACTYFSYLLVWLIKNRLVNDSYISVFGDELNDILTEKNDPARLFMECTDGNFIRDDLTKTGQAFLDSYYYEREYKTKYSTSYITDYEEIVQVQNHQRIYHNFSWDIYRQFEELLDKRYKYYQIDEEFNRDHEEHMYDGSGEEVYSETFEQSVEIVAFSGVTDEYKNKCIAHVKNMPKICYDRIYRKIDEIWGFDEGTNPDTLRKDTSAMTVIIPKPYGDEIAYILGFEAEFEPEHGVSVIIRNDMVIGLDIKWISSSPWSWDSEVDYGEQVN